MAAKPTSAPTPPDLSSLCLEHAPLPMATVEGARHIVRYVNPAFCRLMGKPKEQLVGKPFAEKMPEKDEYLTLLDRVYRTGKSESHTEHEHSGPRPVFWSYTMWPVIADERPVGVMIQMTETVQLHGKMLAMNEALMLGSVRQHELAEAAESSNAELQEEISERKQAEEEIRRLNEDLERRVLERTAEINAANLRLRESEGRLRLLISTTHQAAWDWDIPGHRFWHQEDLSTAAEGVVDPVEGTGARWVEHIHPEDREQIANRLQALLAGDGRLWSEEYRYRKPDGSYAFVLERGVIARDHEGRPLRMAGVMLDITARKNAEEEIRRLNEDLERRVLERTAAIEAANQELEAFSYSVSHDLRAPLRHIDGFTGLLAKHLDPSLDATGRRYLAKVSGSARQMGELIDDLLTFSGIGRAELRSTRLDLSALVEEVLRVLEPETAGRAIEWIMNELPEAQGDPQLLRLVFQNLIDNALKYTRPNRRARIEIGVTREGAELIFSIRDNGVGFDMRYVERLYGVFQRLHSGAEFEGTGIGLANVKRIVHRHGGRVWAEGAVGEGACFYFSLPDLA